MVAFLFGGLISVASGYIGMKVATQGNARTTVSAKQSLAAAFEVAINSGAVMGFALVSLAVLGLVTVYVVMSFLMSDLGVENNHIHKFVFYLLKYAFYNLWEHSATTL